MSARWIVRGALLFVIAFANLNDIWSPDVLPNALFSWTVLRDGDVHYEEFTGADGIDRGTYFFRSCDPAAAPVQGGGPPRSAGGPPPPREGEPVCSIFPPGMALAALPFFAPFVLAGAPTDLTLLLRVGHVVAALVEAVATCLVWLVVRRFTGVRVALGLVLLYALGTSVRTVASQALWQHAGVHLVLASGLAAIGHDGPLTRRAAVLSGLALGAGALVRQTSVLATLAVVGAFARIPRSVAVAVAGAAPGLVLLALYGLAAFGAPLEQGYGTKPFDAGALPAALAGLLTSASRGLFVYEPWTLAAVAALALAWRRHGAFALRLRLLGVGALATLALYASYPEWWGGRVFGPRFLDDLAPLFVVAIAWGIREGLLAGRAASAAFVAAGGWSLLLFQAAAFAYDQRWDSEPVSVNFAPERLFSWTNPQWSAVLGDAATGGPRVLAALLLTTALVALLARLELREAPAREPSRLSSPR